MTASIRPLVACVIDLRPGSRQPDLLAMHEAVIGARHGGRRRPSPVTTLWHDEVEYLFYSLRHFGGSLADAPAEALYIGTLDPELERRLRGLDVDLHPVSTLEPRQPLANKLRMLETTTPYDVLVMLDGDTVIAADFSDFLRTDAISAMPVETDRMGNERWRLLYECLGLRAPEARCRTTFNGEEIIPYFNSGVVFVPQQYARRLYDSWLYYLRLLLDRWPELPAVLTEGHRDRYFTEENAFALALTAAGLPFSCLPLEMNFPTHVALGPPFPEHRIRIIHQYHRITREGLVASTIDEANDVFLRLNEIVHARDAQDVAHGTS